MSPERAKILMAEDDEEIAELIMDGLEFRDHSVYLFRTLEETLEAINNFEEGDIDVALVDGNLTRGDGSGEDGERIAQALRGKFPNLPIISTSTLPTEYGDLSLREDFDNSSLELADYIREL